LRNEGNKLFIFMKLRQANVQLFNRGVAVISPRLASLTSFNIIQAAFSPAGGKSP
jgi:hypothetical protein